jgi:hypothetical protein
MSEMKKIFVNGTLAGEVPATGDPKKDMEIARQFLKDHGLHQEVTVVERS